jgi:hypothetical protein
VIYVYIWSVLNAIAQKMNFIRHFIVVIALYICATPGNKLTAQGTISQNLTIRTLSEDSKIAIAQVNIQILNTNTGITTNETGFCGLLYSSFPLRLRLSHIAFEDKDITILKTPKNDTIVILMKPRTVLLSEIDVSGTKLPNQYYEKVNIIDFEIFDNKLLILEHIRNPRGAYKLTMTNLSFDTLLTYAIPHGLIPTGIYKDCLLQCHLTTKDTTYQIIINDSSFATGYPMENDRFKHIMESCLFMSGNSIYFKETSSEGYQNNFYSVETSNKSIKPFRSEFQLKRVNEMNESIRWTRRNPGLHDKAAMFFDKYYMFLPMPQVMMSYYDSLVFFNHPHGIIEVHYGGENIERAVEISYHNHTQWNKKILKDDAREQFYTFLGDELCAIDLNNGTALKSLKLGVFHKIRVHNGFAYMLKSNYAASGTTHRLIEKVKLPGITF